MASSSALVFLFDHSGAIVRCRNRPFCLRQPSRHAHGLTLSVLISALVYFLPALVFQDSSALSFESWGPRQCYIEPVSFKYNMSVPYTYEEQRNGEKPFNFSAHCHETQQCLGLRDDALFNLRAAAPGSAFLIFENRLMPDLSPPDGQSIIDNAKILFDDHSVMHIQGVGTFPGAAGIGSYLAIPHAVVSGIVKTSDFSRKMTVIDHNRIIMEIERLQEWTHIPNQTIATQVRLELTFYPCSVRIKTITMELTPFTLVAFSGAAVVPGMHMRMNMHMCACMSITHTHVQIHKNPC